MIAHHHGEYPLTLMCRVLSVPRSTFYAWRGREPSQRAGEDATLRVLIAANHQRARQEYGARNHRRELAEAGHCISRRRTRRLMVESGCEAVMPRRWKVTTVSDPRKRAAPNRLNRKFAVSELNRVWAADVTYCWTMEGWLYLAVVIDLCSRRVVGWAASDSIDHELVVEAWNRAVALRQPGPKLLHHSDRGSVYGSREYRKALRSRQAVASMSRKGDCWDNAAVESFFATLKRGLVLRRSWYSRSELRRELASYIDGWYNQERRHSTLGYVSPARYERELRQAA
ncbi:MAG TPA: IS3 family transposase [Gemmatimonadales bacterium]|nr:IS3 family transposase [Gemmatimonadales bacterium]